MVYYVSRLKKGCEPMKLTGMDRLQYFFYHHNFNKDNFKIIELVNDKMVIAKGKNCERKLTFILDRNNNNLVHCQELHQPYLIDDKLIAPVKKRYNWGGSRIGAGRKHSTNKAKHSIYCTHEELQKVRNYLAQLRSEQIIK